MNCTVHPPGTLGTYTYVVIFSRYRGKLLLSRHQKRVTWETQGGHIEPGETPREAAMRELREESGALTFSITPLCDYRAGPDAAQANGMVFVAEIESLGSLPPSEMAETRLFDCLPEQITYPAITPMLYRYWQEEIASHA